MFNGHLHQYVLHINRVQFTFMNFMHILKRRILEAIFHTLTDGAEKTLYAGIMYFQHPDALHKGICILTTTITPNIFCFAERECTCLNRFYTSLIVL